MFHYSFVVMVHWQVLLSVQNYLVPWKTTVGFLLYILQTVVFF